MVIQDVEIEPTSIINVYAAPGMDAETLEKTDKQIKVNTKELNEKLVKEKSEREERERIDIIESRVCAVLGFVIENLYIYGRNTDRVMAKRFCIYFLASYTAMSYRDITKRYKIDRTNFYAHLKSLENDISIYKKDKNDLEKCKRYIEQAFDSRNLMNKVINPFEKYLKHNRE